MPFDSEVSQKSRDLIVLEKARERIARGWCQSKRHSDWGEVCIIGAIETVLLGEDHPNISPHYDLAEPYALALGFSGACNYLFAAKWNDAPGRTQAEVLARFDEAIARLAGRS